MRNKRSKMCKTCIYRCDLAKDNRELLGSHNCHESKSNVICAGSVGDGRRVHVVSSKSEESAFEALDNKSTMLNVVAGVISNRTNKPISQIYYRCK